MRDLVQLDNTIDFFFFSASASVKFNFILD